MQHSERYKTILIIVTGLLVASIIFKSTPLLYGASVVGALSAFIPAVAKAVEWCWLKLAAGLGWVNSRILLSLIYFIFLLPIAWISRLFTRDPLMLKRPKVNSLFVTRNHTYSKKDLENIW